ncbi:MAG: SDR family NAD(P)-dependent oxidoreductase [Phycisphaeraceae bacterium]|nr:SDR family NAD(P)-dependent oxidoreductase [Phycisphaeraceae bacterium]
MAEQVFTNRLVIVTGGTGALGSAVVGRLLAAGARVSVPCVHPKEHDRFPHKSHERVRVSMGVELTDEGAVERFYAESMAWGSPAGSPRPVWASIHIAGGFGMKPVAETSRDEFVSMMQTNALTCFLCCREAVRAMARGGGGRIVNVAARPAIEPRLGVGMVPYTASKAAVAAMTQALGEEVVGRGVLVSAVVPSIMDTPANRAAMPDADHSKWPSVDSVAATVCFLASPENTSTRSALVPVYGGS